MVSTSVLALDLTLTSCQHIARDCPKDTKNMENHIMGHNNYFETILIALDMDLNGPKVAKLGLAPDSTLTSCQDIARGCPKT